MKFTDNYQVKGERVREFFALLPVKCGKEIKWLEKVTIREEFRYGSSKGSKWYKAGFVSAEPKLGDTRLLYTFIWRPKMLWGWTRFLCWVTISQLHNGEKWTNQCWAHYL